MPLLVLKCPFLWKDDFFLVFSFRTIKSWQHYSGPPNLFKRQKQIHETQIPVVYEGNSEKTVNKEDVKSSLSVRHGEDGYEAREPKEWDHTQLLG